MRKELNLFVLLTTTLVRYWRVLGGIFVLATLLAVVYMFSLPRYYTSMVQVIPETKQNGSFSLPGGLVDVASIAGISLNSMSGDDAINPDIYPDIFKSTNFIVDVLNIEVETLEGKRMSYYDYVMKYRPMPWWEHLLSNDTMPEKLPQIEPKRLTREQERLLREIQQRIQCFIDKKTGMIDLRITAFEPSVAATLADGIMAKLQGYITDYRTSKIRNDIAYSEQLAKTAKADYEKAQRAYVSYSDSHQGAVLSQYQTRRTELENEMQLQYQQYNQVQQQLIFLQGKLQERVPAFTVIQSASIPTRPAGPKRVFGVMGIVGFTLFVSFVVLAIQTLRQWYKSVQTVDNED
ncbi:MAG: Wzz/FepE/Etk N-terminal domain-containing protein [Bacteroidales bacterium]|nr:Wzz/FepE/Etk N-terminal domain-containing protein [Bacteroidales bacterium]